MWNKQPTQQSPEPPRHEPAQQPPAAFQTQAPPPPQSVKKQPAVIGPSMTIKGEIRAREELMVDGEVEGSIESQSQITVGVNGKVKSNIRAREVVIFGSVRGNVEVAEKIAIRDQGSLVGDIKAAGISIDDGAYFKGSIDISRPEPKVTTKPVKHEPAHV
jgi:cytoskeletal protein CcmA (bactofilin family)